MADMSSLDFAMMVEDTHIDTVLTEYRARSGTGDQPGYGSPARGLPDRPPRRRPVAGLFLLRSRRRAPVARQLMSFSTISRRRAASACPMSISAIGSRGRRRWATRPATCRRSASACTAGRGWSGRAAGSPRRSLLRGAIGRRKTPVLARSHRALKDARHCEERSDEAIHLPPSDVRPFAARAVRLHPR